MTKKSAARLARDAQEKEGKKSVTDRINENKIKQKEMKENHCWDDLNQMYEQMITLLRQHSGISALASNKTLISNVVNKQTLVSNINSLAQDLCTMNAELTELKALHDGRVGSATDPDDLILCLQTFERYKLFMERHDAVIMPTAMYIIEQFDEA